MRSNPISFNVAPFVEREFCKVSIEIPVSCPAFVKSPSTLPVWLESTLNFVIIASTLSIELFRSVPLISANSINFFERSSSVSPVDPKRVFTSPIAIPAVSASIGNSEKTVSIELCKPSSASPVAPVFVIIVSYPLSSSLNDFIAPAPTAATPAVTGRSFFPSASDFSPIFPAASPTFSSVSLLSFACDSKFFK